MVYSTKLLIKKKKPLSLLQFKSTEASLFTRFLCFHWGVLTFRSMGIFFDSYSLNCLESIESNTGVSSSLSKWMVRMLLQTGHNAWEEFYILICYFLGKRVVVMKENNNNNNKKPTPTTKNLCLPVQFWPAEDQQNSVHCSTNSRWKKIFCGRKTRFVLWKERRNKSCSLIRPWQCTLHCSALWY